nr:hypothetical protein [Jiella mangrovi]
MQMFRKRQFDGWLDAGAYGRSPTELNNGDLSQDANKIGHDGRRRLSKPVFEPLHEVHSFMQDGNDDRPVLVQEDEIMMFAAVETNALRKTAEGFRSRPLVADGFAACLNSIEIGFGLVEAPCFEGIAPDAAQIRFGGKRKIIGRHGVR